MMKLFTEDEAFNPADKAEGLLTDILDETSEKTKAQTELEASVEDELHRESMIVEESSRVRSRVLFVTKNASVLDADSDQQHYFKNIGEVFDEIHIILLGTQKRKTDTVRLAPKVWVYPTSSKSFLRQPFAAFATAKQQLQFTDGFRPDVIVALDPFESGIAGYFIARKFNRSFQLHISEDFYNTEFENADKHNKWRLRFSRYVLKRTDSVRVSTDVIRQKIKDHNKNIKDVVLLPRYFNIQEIIEQVHTTPLEHLYDQFSFTILYVGTLTQDSTLFRAIDAVRAILRTPTIGFVVIGDGPAKGEFQERAKILGVDKQTIFKPKVDNLIAHMRVANVIICTDTTSESEEVVVKAAAAGLPLIMARTPLREDLFSDGVDSFLCDPRDTQEFTQKLVKFLNTNSLRMQFSQYAREVVETRIEEDPHLYRLAVRDSIESVLYVDQTTNDTEAEPNQKKETTTPEPLSASQTGSDAVEMKMPEMS